MEGDSPEDVVRAYLEAERTFAPTAVHTTGLLFTLSDLSDRANAAMGATAEQSTCNVRRLGMRSLDDQRAVVDVVAFVVIHAKTTRGTGTYDLHFRGPFELVRDAGRWKIESYVLDGIPMPGSAYDPVAVDPPVRLAAHLMKRSTIVMAEVTNDSGHAVEISELTVRVRRWRFLPMEWGAIEAPARLPPGESWVGAVAWPRAGLRTPLRVRLVTDGQPSEAILRPPTVSLAPRAWLRQHNLSGVLLGVFLMLAVANGLAVGGWGFLGIGLVTAAAQGIAIGLRHLIAGFASSGAVALLAGGIAVAAVGAVVMGHFGFDRGSTAVLIASLLFAHFRGFAAAHHARRVRGTYRPELARG